jgi:hypothetical protein
MAVITPADWNSVNPATGIQMSHIFRTVELTAAQVVQNNLVKLAKLPAGYRIVDLILESDDLDTHGTATSTVSVGVLKADESAFETGMTMITASEIPKTGGLARIDTKSLETIGASTSERTVALLFVAAVGTAAAGGVTISMTIAPE